MTTDQPPKWKTVTALTVDQRLCKASDEGEDALDKAWDRPYIEPESAIEREEYFIKKFKKCNSEDELDYIINQMRENR
jgi:hypothetical protein